MKGKRLSQGGVIVLVLLLAAMVVTVATSPSTAQTQKPQYGGVLKAIAQGGPTVLGYPSKMRPSFHGGQVFACIESLFSMDIKGHSTPWLAESWEWSQDGKSIAIKLKKGVKFHDGTEFNAESVKWNLEQSQAARKPAVRLLASMGVLDKHTIGLKTRRFDNTFLAGLAGIDGMMVSPTAIEKNGVEWAMLNPVGTGPFKFVEFKRDVTFKLTKFDQYWKKGKPYLDGIEFIYITDPTVASASFLAGNANIFMSGILGKEVADLKKKGYKVLTIYTGGGQFLAPDSANPNSPFAKKKVREAIAYAVDTTPIAETLGHGYWVTLNGQLAGPGSMGHVPDFKGRPYNPEKAKQLLKEAGYPNGFKTKIIPWPTPDPHVAIQAQLAKVGIKAELDVPDKGKLESIWFGGWKNALVWRGTGGSANYTSQLPSLFGAKTPWLPSMRRPDGLAELVDKATMARDYDTQVKLTQQCMKMLADDATLLPLWGVRFSYVVDEKIHDTGLAEFHNIIWTPENAWLSK
ncbi:MAG: ABC transporter substrate-binding protein [Deltaproteobacteria bacterium]|nr:ABC transporter substrate-binding protein [Deltaproteobacteria bacterium]